MLPSIFKPQYSYKLLRVGSRYDGGYLVESNSLYKSECLISFGISTNWDFEKDFLNKNKIDLIAFDGSINETFWKNQKLEALKKFKRLSFAKYFRNYLTKKRFYQFFNNKNFVPKYISNTLGNSISFEEALNFTKKENIFLKIDIEGSEYEIINEIIHQQKKFVGIIIEFHKCGQNLDSISDFIKKIDLELSHIHANNNDDCDEKGVPETIEISFSRSPKRLGNYISLPDKLDRPNKKNRKEIILKFNN